MASVLGTIARLSEPVRVWYRWPFVAALAIILGHRENLRRHNLSDTETAPPRLDAPVGVDVIGTRAADGSFNDLGKPWMGRAGARFGRNVPLANSFGETPPELHDPSPRLVSNRLLARRAFVPVPHLNVLAAAWIQFMVHDWLSHGPNDPSKLHDVPLPPGDDWPGGRMTVPHTTADADTNPHDAGRAPTFRNSETHWWDASQVYGSTAELIERVRTGPETAILPDGRLWLDPDGMLPIDALAEEDGLELAGVNGNWWIGLSVLHTLFAREHNAVVDRLRLDHPGASGEWLFQKARLVISALLAKIHTVEWTPALMDSPVGRMAMRGNYWGLLGERDWRAYGRASDSEIVSGIPGSPQEHHGAPYAMTEEFAAVYRLHSLMPDAFSFRSANTDAELLATDLLGVAGPGARRVYDTVRFEDVVYSLATSNPGALVLNNYPETLRRLPKNNGKHLLDLAAVDILRDRERGVPRFKEFRRLTGMHPPETFADITTNAEWQTALREVYGSVEKVDLLVGTLAESQSERGAPPRFGFSDTAFRIFILMASRRFKSDRFFTDDFRPEIYTHAGFDWVTHNSLRSVLERHVPALAAAFADVRNPFFPWARGGR